MARKKNISKTLNEVIRVKISDRSSYNNIFLVDDQNDLYDDCKVRLPDKEIDRKILNGELATSKAICSSKILINESELIRIIKTLNPENNKTDGSEYPFVRDLVILKVGRGHKKYSDLIEDGELGVLYLNGIAYKRFICASGHNRAKKAMFIREELYDKVFEILMCGIDSNDPNNKVLPCKQNAYFGLPATDSVVVSTPNIVVVHDYKKDIEQEYDVVYGNVSKDDYYVKPEKRKVEILPFDGGGLIDKDKAQEWADELGLDYLPSSWQVRCIPAIKGNLFVFDIKKFSEIYGVSKITDVWGDTWDLATDKIDCIMTESQWKYWKMYSSFADWKEAFDTDLYGYHRTFNISEYAVACRKPSETSESKVLKDIVLLSYQPLQTL